MGEYAIKRTEIEGRPCYVAEMGDGMVKVVFDDGDEWIAERNGPAEEPQKPVPKAS